MCLTYPTIYFASSFPRSAIAHLQDRRQFLFHLLEFLSPITDLDMIFPLMIFIIFLNCPKSTAEIDAPACELNLPRSVCSDVYICESYCEKYRRGFNVKAACFESSTGTKGSRCVCYPRSSTSNERNYFPVPSSSRKLLTAHQDQSFSFARKAVFSARYQDTGTTGTTGILSKDGVVLVGERNHVACAVAGIKNDANILINTARVQAQPYTYAFQEPMLVEQLVQSLCDTIQGYTQFGGLCPFGVSFLFVGWDRNGGFQLYICDPSCHYGVWKDAAIAANNQEAQSMLKQDYKDGITREEAVQLALKVLGKIMDGTNLTSDKLELAEVFLTPSGDVKYQQW